MPARIGLIAVGVVVVLVGGWWVYPTAAREPSRLDVVIVGDGQVSQASEPLARRVRELGMTVTVVEADACGALGAVADLVADRHPSVVVLSPSAAEGCGTEFWPAARGAAGDARLVALLQPGLSDGQAVADVDAADVEVADASRLLGTGSADEPAPARIGCEWWDDCAPDGQVDVRDDSGALTPAGGERLARVLAGVLP